MYTHTTVRHPTPFFAGFGPLLFGKPRKQSIEALLHPEATPRSLSQFQSAFGHFIPKALLSPAKEGPNSRERVFTPLITFWAFLAQVLERGSSCRDAVLRIVAWWKFELRDEATPSVDTSAYCQARSRLPEATLAQIGDHLAEQMLRNTPSSHLWRGRRVKMLDGTTASMPDTAKNQRLWPQSREQQPGCGFPFLKLVGLFCLATGAMLQYVEANKHQHEAALARRLWPFLDPQDVLLADRGFCSYITISELLRLGVDAVMRMHQMRQADFRRGRRLGANDRLVTWNKPLQRTPTWTPEQFAAMPPALPLRMVRYRIQTPGFRSEEVVLVTTLLDPKLYPVEALAELYFQRWSVELHFREIKCLLGMDVLRCLSPRMIRKELAMHRIAYNLVRALMQRAAITYHVDLGRLSFKGALDGLHHFAAAIHACAGKHRKQAELLQELLLAIACDEVPLRPNRTEPRAKKRRPKNYHLLTKPRRKMTVPAHRNRPRRNLRRSS